MITTNKQSDDRQTAHRCVLPLQTSSEPTPEEVKTVIETINIFITIAKLVTLDRHHQTEQPPEHDQLTG